MMMTMCLASPALAQPSKARTAQAEALIGKARAHLKAKRWSEAIKDLEGAYALDPKPPILFNIAVAHDKNDQCAQALGTFERFFAACGTCKLKGAATKRQAKVRTSCVAKVKLDSVPTGAELLVDGKSRGKAPLELELLAGPHVITARMEGREDALKPLQVEGGKAVELRIELPEPAPTTGRIELVGVPVGAQVEVDGAVIDLDSELEVKPGPHTVLVRFDGEVAAERKVDVSLGETALLDLADVQRPKVEVEAPAPVEPAEGTPFEALSWTGYGVGAAGLVMGVVFTVLRSSDQDELAKKERSVDFTSDSGKAELDDARDAIHRDEALMSTGYTIGLIGIGAGVALMLLDGAVQGTAGPGSAGVQGTF